MGDDSQVKVPDHIGLHVSNEKVIGRENMTYCWLQMTLVCCVRQNKH